MALTDAQICNIALLRIGQRQTIESLEDDSEEANACNQLFEPARDAVLQELWWSFARRRASLAELSDFDSDEWAYGYSLPSDCVATRYIDIGVEPSSQDDMVPFEVELNSAGTGRVLITNMEDAVLVYTAKVTNPDLFSPTFVQALAWSLASDLALSLPVKPQVGLAMQQAYRAALMKAATSDANMVQKAPIRSPFVNVR